MVFSPGQALLVTKSGEVAVRMSDLERSAGRGRVSVMAVVARSGAAVSPMAGRFSFAIAPFRVLLTLFNVRVGTWVRNPLWGPAPSGTGHAGRWP
ncbi:MAG: hypothetical protein M3Q27_18850 [Actinomycetota bacterium]|nr:hypothetical protein [Actinomycetota bacterium]